MDVVDRYLELGLRLGRHLEGIVDAYFGPPELRARVEAEEPRDATALAADAEALREELAASDLPARRRAWLDDQLVALGTAARLAAGEDVPYAEEVERCFGVRAVRTPERTFAAAHERLEELLLGDGSLAARYQAWRDARTVPPDAMLDAFEGVRAALREATARRYGLPGGEDVETRLAKDELWLAYNYYLGGRRSRIEINTDLPISADELVELAAHEAYPGHHTEHAWKEALLVDAGVVEEAIVLLPTPQCTVSEAIAENALDAALDDEAQAAVERALAEGGIALDLAEARRVRAARRPLRGVGLNVALMLHEDGASDDEGTAYAERWAAVSPEYAAATMRFVRDPLSRAYAATYSLGGELARRHVAGRDERFRALLTEQTRVADMLPVSSAP